MSEDKKIATNPAFEALAGALQTSFIVLKAIMLLIVLAYIFSGMYMVKSYQQAMVFRFGRLDRIESDGLHFAWPAPIERVEKVSVRREQSFAIKDFYFKSTADGKNSAVGKTLSPVTDGYLITGDTNIVHALMTVHYRLSDLRSYYNTVGTVEKEHRLLKLAVKNGAVIAGATMAVDPLLRHGAISFKDAIEFSAKNSLKNWGTGIEIASVEVSIVPPRQVKKEFDKVLLAEQNKSEEMSKAKGKAQRILNQSRGDVSAVLASAKTLAAQSLAQARADAKYLQTIINKYGKDKTALNLFVVNTRFARLKRILKQVEAKYFLPDGGKELRLRLGLDPQRINKDAEESENDRG